MQEKIKSVTDKFSFIDSIKFTVNGITSVLTNPDNAPVFTIKPINNKWVTGDLNVIDLTWYAPFKEYGDIVICCFAYAFFFWRIFINLPNIISGAGGVVDTSSELQDIEAYRRFGFGRRKHL